MGRKGQSITLSVSEQDKAQLEAIAREQDLLWQTLLYLAITFGNRFCFSSNRSIHSGWRGRN
jgi:hypothetical protein